MLPTVSTCRGILVVGSAAGGFPSGLANRLGQGPSVIGWRTAPPPATASGEISRKPATSASPVAPRDSRTGYLSDAPAYCRPASRPYYRSNSLTQRTHSLAPLRLLGRPSDLQSTPPCIWTFVSGLGENRFFSILLGRARTPGHIGESAREVEGVREARRHREEPWENSALSRSWRSTRY